MAQWLRKCTVPAEDPNSVPSISMWLTTTISTSPGASGTLSGLCEQGHYPLPRINLKFHGILLQVLRCYEATLSSP